MWLVPSKVWWISKRASQIPKQCKLQRSKSHNHRTLSKSEQNATQTLSNFPVIPGAGPLECMTLWCFSIAEHWNSRFLLARMNRFWGNDSFVNEMCLYFLLWTFFECRLRTTHAIPNTVASQPQLRKLPSSELHFECTPISFANDKSDSKYPRAVFLASQTLIIWTRLWKYISAFCEG
jgi:hypothetical protein